MRLLITVSAILTSYRTCGSMKTIKSRVCVSTMTPETLRNASHSLRPPSPVYAFATHRYGVAAPDDAMPLTHAEAGDSVEWAFTGRERKRSEEKGIGDEGCLCSRSRQSSASLAASRTF
jgi:hypothetical protein